MPLAAPPGPLWTADAKEPHPLAIRSELDENSYPTGQPVTAEQMESLSLKRDKFHGDWNYSLRPRETT